MVYRFGRSLWPAEVVEETLQRLNFSLLEVSKSNKKSRFCSVIWAADCRYDRYSACDAAWVLRRFLDGRGGRKMSDSLQRELIQRTGELLEAICSGDWQAYEAICDPGLTAFEPEARGQLVEGMEFHRFYFDLGGHLGKHVNTMVAPHVRILGPDVAVVSYVRLVQQTLADGTPQTNRYDETRIWERQQGVWRHVHFHRSRND